MNLRWLGLAALTLGACNNVDTAIAPLYPILPEFDMTKGCTWAPDGEVLLDPTIDVGVMRQLWLGISTVNNLQSNSVEVAVGPPESFSQTNAWRPLRFDYAWECDSHSFFKGLPPITVPAFSVTQPFCYDQTADTENFVGTDVVPVTGSAIESDGGVGIIQLRAVTPQTRDAIAGTFTIAQLAEACCVEAADGSGGCYDAQGRFDVSLSPNVDSCTDLDNVLRGQSAGALSTENSTGVELFRPFAYFTKNDGAKYPMRLHGVFEGVTGDGSTITSADFTQDIGFQLGNRPAGLCQDF